MAARTLEYRHLEVFRAVMRTGSVTGAGALLGVSQPGVSRLLAQTETLAGFPLFQRLGGRLVPTEQAHALHVEAERVFIGVQEIAALTERLRRGTPRRIVVAAIPVLTLAVLPRATAEWSRTERREQLIIHSGTVGRVIGMVASRQADLGLVTEIPSIPGLRTTVLARSKAFCAVAAGHRLAGQAVVRAADLDGEAYIALSREEGRQAKVDAALESSGAQPREIAECRMTSGAAAMAAAGAGITVLDSLAAAPSLGSGLVLRPFEPAIEVTYRLIWPEDAPDNFGRAALFQAIRSSVRSVLNEVRRKARI